jgi:hypothetical protein
VKPKNWKQINAVREGFYSDVFDDLNEVLGKLQLDVGEKIDAARMELHRIMQNKSEIYKNHKFPSKHEKVKNE